MGLAMPNGHIEEGISILVEDDLTSLMPKQKLVITPTTNLTLQEVIYTNQIEQTKYILSQDYQGVFPSREMD